MIVHFIQYPQSYSSISLAFSDISFKVILEGSNTGIGISRTQHIEMTHTFFWTDHVKKMWARPDLNRRPPGYEPGAPPA